METCLHFECFSIPGWMMMANMEHRKVGNAEATTAHMIPPQFSLKGIL
jgi:hypothetical protein